MESDLQQHQHQHHYHIRSHQQKQRNSGLTRYQSAPSSLFSSFDNRDSLEEFLNRPTSPETERIFSSFLQSSGSNSNIDSFLDQSFADKKPEIKVEEEYHQIEAPRVDETETTMNQKHNLQHQSQLQHQSNNSMLNRNPGSNLLRQSSSPAGFFSTVDIENAYATVMRNMGGVAGGGSNTVINNKETSFSTPRSMQPILSSKLTPPVPDVPDNKPNYSAGLPPRTLSGGLKRSCWQDSSTMSDNSSSQNTPKKRDRTLSGGLDLSETKKPDAAKRPPLAHHRSLPKSLSDIEKLMESSDSVPWNIRAKRGCATHPRSIAERVRRTRISERIKKLQDLVPNMDKQTNTAEMLDLAVDYIKDLQEQIKILSEHRAKCTCTSMRIQSVEEDNSYMQNT